MAISGWRDVIIPALRARGDIAMWPFQGHLHTLLRPGGIVIAETYPAEMYGALGIRFPQSRQGQKSGKRVQNDRIEAGQVMVAWAEAHEIGIDSTFREQIQNGFGESPDGEDPFDATVGLLGMIGVVSGILDTGEPDDLIVQQVEGWILGQKAYSGI